MYSNGSFQSLAGKQRRYTEHRHRLRMRRDVISGELCTHYRHFSDSIEQYPHAANSDGNHVTGIALQHMEIL
jgi:hypothetical protein